MRSLTVGMPSGRVLPSPFGISTRLIGSGWYVPSRSAVESSVKYRSACLANRSRLCPSTPAAPPLAQTLVPAASSTAGAYTLSIRLNQRPPLTPFSSADTMRSVQTEASTHDQSRASAPCVALAGTVDALSCLIPSVPHPPSCPAFPRRGFALRASRGSSPLRYYAGSDPCRASPARQVSPFRPLAFRASNPQPRRASERHVPITSCVGRFLPVPRLRLTLASSPQHAAESGS